MNFFANLFIEIENHIILMIFVRSEGFEPSTPRAEIWYSIQLNYGCFLLWLTKVISISEKKNSEVEFIWVDGIYYLLPYFSDRSFISHLDGLNTHSSKFKHQSTF